MSGNNFTQLHSKSQKKKFCAFMPVMFVFAKTSCSAGVCTQCTLPSSKLFHKAQVECLYISMYMLRSAYCKVLSPIHQRCPRNVDFYIRHVYVFVEFECTLVAYQYFYFIIVLHNEYGVWHSFIDNSYNIHCLPSFFNFLCNGMKGCKCIAFSLLYSIWNITPHPSVSTISS